MSESVLPFHANESTPLNRKHFSVAYSPINASEDVEPSVLSRITYNKPKLQSRTTAWFMIYFVFLLVVVLYFTLTHTVELPVIPVEKAAWSSVAEPFSTVRPGSLGMHVIDRPYNSMPGAIFDGIDKKLPLPTNSWYQNLFLGGASNAALENNVFQVPYIIDTSGLIQGIRTHPAHVQANDRTVMMTYEPESGLSLGAVEQFLPQHYVRSQGTPAVSKLGVELEWLSPGDSIVNVTATGVYHGPSMRSPLVRGTPYSSMTYLAATPRIFVQRALAGSIVVDNDPATAGMLSCGAGYGHFSKEPVLVQREIKFHLDTSDTTWLVFVSEPTAFVCSTQAAQPMTGPALAPGVLGPAVSAANGSLFELRATKPMTRGMVRIAMANNCTTGQNPIYCGLSHKAANQSAYEELLRFHADVYPTAKSDIQFTFPVSSSEEEELRLIFDWKPALMSRVALEVDGPAPPQREADSQDDDSLGGFPAVELLMYALPHHQERVRPIVGSSNEVMALGCSPTIHGIACPIKGSAWSLVEHLHRVNFTAPRPMRPEMMPAIKKALAADMEFALPANYMAGAGDTYFSGKMLAKLARILLIADEVGSVDDKTFLRSLGRLRAGVEVWLNGSAESPFLYDQSYGGMVMCGCDYIYENNVGSCANAYPNCPALVDAGQNFGAGFYNDHHYHYGYHIFAAAVVSKFDAVWGRKFHQHVLMLVRDIANPSDADEYFPTWRHKDWFLGFSWASGVVTISGKPYPNGRNQESSSEAISAYEAVALYGGVMADLFAASLATTSSVALQASDGALHQSALRVRDMGRLMAATEIRSAITYWHVQDRSTKGVSRIYPDIYAPKVVGMMWSMLAQEQTWFGNEPWKSYGIQLMPITPLSEQRDTVSWVTEMLPLFNQSCATNPICEKEGWSILVSTCLATIGQWRLAERQVSALAPSVFLNAGGNGHSLSNTLWYIATRPDAINATLVAR